MNNNASHRWSGWPGAFCLDCGIEDPMENEPDFPHPEILESPTEEEKRANAVILKSHIQRCEEYGKVKTPHQLLIEYLADKILEGDNWAVLRKLSLESSGPYGFEVIHREYPNLWETEEGKKALKVWEEWPGGFREYP